MNTDCFWHPGEHDSDHCPGPYYHVDAVWELVELAIIRMGFTPSDTYVTDRTSASDFPDGERLLWRTFGLCPKHRELLWEYLERYRRERQ